LKIIHTADWHIGKTLHRLDLAEDHKIFFDWLASYVIQTNADVLLLSGDVFDSAIPTNEAQKLFCYALTQLQRTGIQIVVTGGNHDSITRLHSIEDLLRLVGIEIIGGVPERFDDQIVPLKNRKGELKAICAAVPYLREGDTRQFVSGETQSEKIKAYQNGVLSHFKKLRDRIIDLYPGMPIVAMGHLYMQGSTMSESVREIQIGNAAGLDVTSYMGMFDYFALGHIHIPKRWDKSIRYSGSPIQLDFTESTEPRLVIEVDINEDGLESHGREVPLTRDFVTLTGSWEDIKLGIVNHKTDKPLSPVFNLKINATSDQIPFINDEVNTLKITHEILITKIIVPKTMPTVFRNSGEMMDKVNDLTPLDVFSKKIEGQEFSEVTRDELIELYNHVVMKVNETE
jgi:DNA repair protein SbcD/Mre11